MDLDKEFKRTLTSFVYKELNDRRNTLIIAKRLVSMIDKFGKDDENTVINENNYIEEINIWKKK